MDSLDAHLLHAILGRLEWPDLLAAQACCRTLRTAAGRCWEAQCRRRWHAPNAHLFPAAPAAAAAAAAAGARAPADHRALFLADNGWAPGAPLGVSQWAGCSWEDELVGVGVAPGQPCDTIAVSTCRELRLLHLSATGDGGVQLRPLRAARHSSAAGANAEQWSAVAALSSGGDGGLVAAGGCFGRLALFQLPEHGSGCPAKAAVQPAAALAFPESSCLVSQLHPLPAAQRLAALHDPLALLRPAEAAAGQRGALRLLDLPAWRELAPGGLRDVLDGFELAAAVPLGDGGHEFLAGSVKLSDDQASGWACRRCWTAAPASLCFHKPHASSAALCTFDCRTPGGMVGRYATHHRSLYPHLEPLRGHFLLTSHAGTPVAVWDRRRMNGPVHEVQHVPRDLDPALADALPLGSPEHHDPPATQALHLSATPDVLLGRGDSGMLWAFDLSERMGWADGSHPGTWLRGLPGQQAAAPAAAAGGWEASEGPADAGMAEGYLDETDWERAPLPLGCVGAPYEVWCSSDGEAAPLHWLPPPAVWAAPSGLLALAGLELEDKQALFPAHAHGSPYPSNALVAASLRRPPPR